MTPRRSELSGDLFDQLSDRISMTTRCEAVQFVHHEEVVHPTLSRPPVDASLACFNKEATTNRCR